MKKAITEGDVIRGYFDASFSMNEEKVASILAHAKVKSKWDYKEKSRKQEAVIKELRDGVIKTINELKRVREQCLIHESHSSNLIRDAYDEILDTSHSIAALKQQNDELNDRIAEMQEELFQATSSVMRFKTDQSPLRNRAKESEQRLFDVQGKLVSEEAKCRQLEADMQRLAKELDAAREEKDSLLSSQKLEFEQRLEHSVASYREEVVSLRAELNRRQSDVDRYSGEKADLDKQKQELQNEFLRMKSSLLEKESSSERYSQEAARLERDLTALREQLAMKESDLRSTISSLNELQKQGVEEKVEMRAELLSLQQRVQQMEEEKNALTANLASKKEENISLASDLEHVREKLATCEDKLRLKEAELGESKDLMMQLEVEKELRTRSELREEAERTERIAAVSELLATRSDCDSRIREIEEKQSFEIASLNSTLQLLSEEKLAIMEEKRQANDRAAGLEKEVQQLHNELENASANHEAV